MFNSLVFKLPSDTVPWQADTDLIIANEVQNMHLLWIHKHEDKGVYSLGELVAAVWWVFLIRQTLLSQPGPSQHTACLLSSERLRLLAHMWTFPNEKNVLGGGKTVEILVEWAELNEAKSCGTDF